MTENTRSVVPSAQTWENTAREKKKIFSFDSLNMQKEIFMLKRG